MTSEQSSGTHTGPVTLSDVAQAAGVSKAAVSGVINGKSRVSSATAARIEAAIKHLGYQSNPTARQLRAGRSDAIGLVVPELNRPYFGELASMIADEVSASGKHLVVQRSGGTNEAELAAASFARLRMYDGVIFSVVGIDPAQIEQLQFTTPVVLIGERSGDNRFDHVAMDNVGGARLATAFLLERGARRIVLMGGDPSSATPPSGKTVSSAQFVASDNAADLANATDLANAAGSDNATDSANAIEMTKLRTQGYAQAHRAHDHEVPAELVLQLSAFSLEEGRLAVHRLVANGVDFDAVFAVTDVVALGTLRGLAELGLRVPQDVQVIGFDDITEGAYSSPALTTVNPEKDKIARLAVSMLEERISGTLTAPREVIVPTRLTVRETTLP